jgi:hypothetical protein
MQPAHDLHGPLRLPYHSRSARQAGRPPSAGSGGGAYAALAVYLVVLFRETVPVLIRRHRSRQ